jgi:hypothetical protein
MNERRLFFGPIGELSKDGALGKNVFPANGYAFELLSLSATASIKSVVDSFDLIVIHGGYEYFSINEEGRTKGDSRGTSCTPDPEYLTRGHTSSKLLTLD